MSRPNNASRLYPSVWTDAMVAYLVAHWCKVPRVELARKIGVDDGTMRLKANELGLERYIYRPPSKLVASVAKIDMKSDDSATRAVAARFEAALAKAHARNGWAVHNGWPLLERRAA